MSLSARVSIGSNVLALVALAVAWTHPPSALVLSYGAHKTLHILGVVIFAGNLFAGPVWLGVAFFSRDRAQLAFATRALAAADIFLTAPGIQLAVWNGVFLASVFGGVRGQAWLVESMALLVVTSVFSSTLVLFWQERLVHAANAQNAADAPGVRRALVWWSVFGSLVGVPLALVLYLMVTKQALFLS